MERPTLSINISTKRKALGLSQLELAERVGVHRNTIADIERGASEGWPDTRASIAQVLGCSVAELYGQAAGDQTPSQTSMANAIQSLQSEIDQLRASSITDSSLVELIRKLVDQDAVDILEALAAEEDGHDRVRAALLLPDKGSVSVRKKSTKAHSR